MLFYLILINIQFHAQLLLHQFLILISSLVIIIEIELTENNAFYFILDRNFNGISISQTIEKKFFFNLDILKKTDVELINIFNLNPHLIKKSLEKTLDLIKKIKKEIKGNNIEFFNTKLYTTNINK